MYSLIQLICLKIAQWKNRRRADYSGLLVDENKSYRLFCPQLRGVPKRQYEYDEFRMPSVLNNGAAPQIVMIHGGGWVLGHKEMWHKFACDLARDGYIVYCINYPLYRSYGPNRRIQFINMVDAICGFISAVVLSSLSCTSKYVLLGDSAGGTLAHFIGQRSRRINTPKAVVGFSAPTDLMERGSRMLVDFVDNVFPSDLENRHRLSPVNRVTRETPPTCVVHGTADKLVSFKHARDYVYELERHGVTHELIVEHDEGHEFQQKDTLPANEALQGVRMFISKILS